MSSLFENLIICVSGTFQGMTQKEIKKLIEENGGKFQNHVSKNTTHLITTREHLELGGVVVEKATRLGLPVHTIDFLLKSIDLNKVQENKFVLSQSGLEVEGEKSKRPKLDDTQDELERRCLSLLNLLDDGHVEMDLKDCLNEFSPEKKITYVPPAKNYPERRNVDADEAYEFIKRIEQGPIRLWSNQELDDVLLFVRSVNTFFMRGDPKNKRVLDSFCKAWSEFVMSNERIKIAVDPEVVVFDVLWAPPANWAPAVLRGNSNVPAAGQMIGLGVPAMPAPVGGYAVPLLGATSDMVFSTPGPAEFATSFGGEVTGYNSGSCRGFYYFFTVAPILYY